MALADGGPERLVQHQLRDSFQVFTPRPCTPRPPIATHVVPTPVLHGHQPIQLTYNRSASIWLKSSDDKLLEINSNQMKIQQP